jgi:DNA primase
MIPDNVIRDICERANIVAVIGESVVLKRLANTYSGLCPFHREKKASFVVNPERGVYCCYSCHEHGSVIDFVMKRDGKTFPEAAGELAERFGIDIRDGATDNERREAAAAKHAREELYAVNALAATYYEQCLFGGAEMPAHELASYAHAELSKRGVWAARETLAAFRVGYAPHGWVGLVDYLKKHGISPAIAERVGLLVPRSTGGGHYDRFRHRLMFPVLDVSGRAIAFSGRALPWPRGHEPSTEEPAKYINSPESPIYTKGEHLFGLYQARQAVRERGSAVIVEGNFDVMSLHAAGITNAVAPLGTAFTEQQARLLKRFAPSVTIVFDGDTAGKKATWTARGPCRAAGISAHAVALPKGADPDAHVRAHGAKVLTEMIEHAPSLTQHLLDALLRDGELGGASAGDRLACVRAAIQLIGEGDDPLERAMSRSYADQLAAMLIIGNRAPASLRELEAMIVSPQMLPPRASTKGSATEELCLAMLGTLLDCPALLDKPEVQSRLSAIDGAAVFAVAALQSGASHALVERCPVEVRGYVARRLARPVFTNAGDALREFIGTANRLAGARLIAKCSAPNEDDAAEQAQDLACAAP